MSAVAILVPVLRRPHRITPLLGSVEEATPEPHRVLFIASPSDTATHTALDAAGADWIVMDDDYEGRGDYMRKVNRGVAATDEPLIFLAADDLRFHTGWLPAATAELRRGIGVVGTNDLGNQRVTRGTHATHSLLTRDYVERRGTIDEPGKALHAGYHHNFCDDELVCTAHARRAWAFAGTAVVEHLHPNWRKAEDDDVYRLGRTFFHEDRRLFMTRRKLWRRR